MYIHTYIHTYIYIYKSTDMYVCLSMCMYVYKYICIIRQNPHHDPKILENLDAVRSDSLMQQAKQIPRPWSYNLL